MNDIKVDEKNKNHCSSVCKYFLVRGKYVYCKLKEPHQPIEINWIRKEIIDTGGLPSIMFSAFYLRTLFCLQEEIK
jgi:hypothetical protein